MAPSSEKSDSTRRRKAEPRAQLVVKIGGGEVRFEAGLTAVEERFDGLLERLLEAWRPQGRGATHASSPSVAIRPAAGETQQAAPPLAPLHGNYPALTLDLAPVAEVFSVNAAGELSLRVMPRGLQARECQADALLLLLYGKLALRGESPVTAPALLRSARQSGLDLKRASRLLAHRARYARAEGRRRGKRYRLTAAGVQYCEDLIRNLDADTSGVAPELRVASVETLVTS